MSNTTVIHNRHSKDRFQTCPYYDDYSCAGMYFVTILFKNNPTNWEKNHTLKPNHNEQSK